MYWQFNPYAIVILFGLVPLGYFVFRAAHQRTTLAAYLFLAASGASLCTLLVYVMELSSADPDVLKLWVQFRYILSMVIPAAGLLFILAYLGMDDWVTWKVMLLLSVVPILRLFAVVTNDSYHLQWSAYTTQEVGSLIFARYQDSVTSPIYWLGQFYILAVAVTMAVVIGVAIVRSPGILRGQILYFLITILLPAFGILIEVLGFNPIPYLNFPVLTLCLAVIPLGLALFRYRLLDIVPAAQSLVLQSMQDAVLVLDMQGRIVQANPAAITLRGSHAKDMIGHYAGQVYGHVPHLIEHFATIFDTRETIEIQAVDEPPRYFDILISPLRNRGGYTSGRVIVLRDITAIKQAEKQAIDLVLERERTKLLKSFINDTSHDIMTPISVMRTSTYLLRALADKISHEVACVKDQQHTASLATIEHSINAIRDKSTNLDASALRLQNLVESMLDMVRLDKQVFAFTPADLNLLVEQAVNLQRFLAEDKGIQLQINAESGLPKVTLDSNQFMRVLQNLLTNALKYTPRGGCVTAHTRQRDDQIILEIQDTGQGIPESDLPLIFDRLYRVDKSRPSSAIGVGLGLGLAIVKTIVTAHQGTIEVESTVGAGSIFRVTLPAIQPPPEENIVEHVQQE